MKADVRQVVAVASIVRPEAAADHNATLASISYGLRNIEVLAHGGTVRASLSGTVISGHGLTQFYNSCNMRRAPTSSCESASIVTGTTIDVDV